MTGAGADRSPDEKLIQALLLEAAYRMEDSSPVLVRAWPADRGLQAVRIAMLTSVAGDLAALAFAAHVLHRVSEDRGTIPS